MAAVHYFASNRAAISFLPGALLSRIGWIAVGKVSGADAESVFAAERAATQRGQSYLGEVLRKRLTSNCC